MVRSKAKEKELGAKGQLSGISEYPTSEPPLAHMPHWDETSYPPELVPLCAAVRNITEEDEHVWKDGERQRDQSKKRDADHAEGELLMEERDRTFSRRR